MDYCLLFLRLAPENISSSRTDLQRSRTAVGNRAISPSDVSHNYEYFQVATVFQLPNLYTSLV